MEETAADKKFGEIEHAVDVTTFHGEQKRLDPLCCGRHDEVSRNTGQIDHNTGRGGGSMPRDCKDGGGGVIEGMESKRCEPAATRNVKAAGEGGPTRSTTGRSSINIRGTRVIASIKPPDQAKHEGVLYASGAGRGMNVSVDRCNNFPRLSFSFCPFPHSFLV